MRIRSPSSLDTAFSKREEKTRASTLHPVGGLVYTLIFRESPGAQSGAPAVIAGPAGQPRTSDPPHRLTLRLWRELTRRWSTPHPLRTFVTWSICPRRGCSAKKQYPVGRKFTKEFKLTAIRRLQSGQSVAEVARALEVHPSELHRWRHELEDHGDRTFSGVGKKRAEESRVA